MDTNYKDLFTSYWKFLALKSACKLELFDFIQNGVNEINKLCKELNLDFQVFSDLISVLINENLILLHNNQLFLTKNGQIFTENHPKTLKYACIHWGEEHMTSWQNLEYTLKTGKPSFEMLYNKPLFEYLEEDNKRLEHYHKAMNEYARDDYENICKKIDFSRYNSILDVGGGLGALINIIAQNNPNIQCYLFDKPKVIDLIKDNKNGINLLKGDFFDKIPKISNTIIMSRVIHDWDDTKAQVILDKVNSALSKKGTLFLIENLTDKIKDKASLLSLNMHLITESYERTERKYRELLNKTNFKVEKIIRINNLQYAIKSKKE